VQRSRKRREVTKGHHEEMESLEGRRCASLEVRKLKLTDG